VNITTGAARAETDAPDYPLFLQLAGRPVLVVGGGPVAARRASRLHDSGAKVRVVSPWAVEDIRDSAGRGELVWHEREFEDHDLADAWLVHACTGDTATDDRVVELADERRVWSIRADDAGRSPAWTAATARTVDGIQFAVNGGRDPGRAVALRDAISDLAAAGGLPIRRRRAAAGRVFLVGAGPGDPDLLTVRARRLLSLADVVVTDRLAPVAALRSLPESVQVVDVGKAPGRHALPQDEINALLVEQARLGRVVVRLKGGDPFVLGRGGEEALACVRAGVAVEVVPGVTSAVSVPAAAGIPVTHRGLSTATLILSAHDGATDVIRRAGAAPAETTLVLMMGVRHLAETAAALVTAGRDPETPVAIVADGWTTHQQVVTGSLATIAVAAEASGIGSPAVIVIGAVAGLHDELGLLGVPSPDSGHGSIA
jgi:uroporphyrin-III C-methyltransferase / precorrin-2 dehydrogenase / sirohydrochlorin ferrochelatase